VSAKLLISYYSRCATQSKRSSNKLRSRVGSRVGSQASNFNPAQPESRQPELVAAIHPRYEPRYSTHYVRAHRPEQDQSCFFLRIDAIRHVLYEGPLVVLERREKTFKVQRDLSTAWISIDRLKPAFIARKDPLADHAHAQSNPLTSNRISHVHFCCCIRYPRPTYLYIYIGTYLREQTRTALSLSLLTSLATQSVDVQPNQCSLPPDNITQ